MEPSKKILLGLTPEEIKKEITEFKLPGFNAREIALWMYRRGAQSFDEMTNISKSGRKLLNEHCSLGLRTYVKENISNDGTKKYLFPTKGSRFIETAYIPEKKRHTLCLSSQVGCKLNCKFCMTGRQGYQGQLDTGEILNQILSIPEKEEITNLVFMGMGEPFENTEPVLKALTILTADYGLGFNPKKITVSTVGILPGMKRFMEKSKCNLAISLHSPFDDERATIMPIQKKYPVTNIIDTLKSYSVEKQRRLSFEYILFKGFNDTPRHINQLTRLLNGLRCRINLMRYHELPGSLLKGTDDTEVIEFRDRLNDKGIIATVRASRGEDIMAACGLLSTLELINQQ